MGGGVDVGDPENIAVSFDGIFNDPLPADQSLYYYRARHVPSSSSGSGVVASDWTEWLVAVARGTQGTGSGGGGGSGGNGDLPTDELPNVGVDPSALVPVLPTVAIARERRRRGELRRHPHADRPAGPQAARRVPDAGRRRVAQRLDERRDRAVQRELDLHDAAPSR
jgi:hypothetical protein